MNKLWLFTLLLLIPIVFFTNEGFGDADDVTQTKPSQPDLLLIPTTIPTTAPVCPPPVDSTFDNLLDDLKPIADCSYFDVTTDTDNIYFEGRFNGYPNQKIRIGIFTEEGVYHEYVHVVTDEESKFQEKISIDWFATTNPAPYTYTVLVYYDGVYMKDTFDID